MKIFGIKEKISKISGKKADQTVKPVPVMEKRLVSRRLVWLILCGVGIAIGIGSFVIYFITTNLALGAPGVIVGLASGFTFWYFWGQDTDIVVKQLGKETIKNANVLVLTRDEIKFEKLEDKYGFPWVCRNDKKLYSVAIQDQPGNNGEMAAFTLPDQQYCSPEYFAERPISLPAHRKLFTRKEKLGDVLKTGLLVVAILIEVILIITTTGD